MTAGSEYIREIFGIKYKLKTDVIIRSKDKDKAQAKGLTKMAPDCRALGKT